MHLDSCVAKRYASPVVSPAVSGLQRQAPRVMFGQEACPVLPSGNTVLPMEEVKSSWHKMVGGVQGLFTNLWRMVTETDYKTAFKRVQQSLWAIAQNTLFFGAVITASFLPIPSFRRYIEQQFLYSPIKCTIREDLKSPTLKDKNRMLDEDFRAKGDNTRLHGWYLPAQQGKPTVVYAHGRDHNISHLEPVIQTFQDRGWGIFLFDYRGFGDSAGKPTEEGLYDDFESACHHLKKKYDIDFSDQIAMGHSMGTAVVTEVAANRIPNFRSVILLSPFTSIEQTLAHQKNRYAFAKWLFNHQIVEAKMDSIHKIGQIQVPVMSLCGEQDCVTPSTMAQALVQEAGSPTKQFVSLPQADHHTETLFSPDNAPLVMNSIERFIESQPPKTDILQVA